MNGLILKAGGILNNVRWVFDDAKREGSDVTMDVTARSSEFLMEDVTLEDGVRLVDVLTLLQKDATLQAIFRRDWAAEYVDEAIKNYTRSYTGEYSEDGLEFLELYSIWEKNTATNEISNTNHLSFHGLGFDLREDVLEDGLVMFRKGTRTAWGLIGSSIGDILDIPLKFNKTILVCEGDTNSSKYGSTVETLVASRPTLGQVIHSILWELSYFGSPKETAALTSRL